MKRWVYAAIVVAWALDVTVCCTGCPLVLGAFVADAIQGPLPTDAGAVDGGAL